MQSPNKKWSIWLRFLPSGDVSDVFVMWELVLLIVRCYDAEKFGTLMALSFLASYKFSFIISIWKYFLSLIFYLNRLKVHICGTWEISSP
jgi:hypothetical protein